MLLAYCMLPVPSSLLYRKQTGVFRVKAMLDLQAMLSKAPQDQEYEKSITYSNVLYF